MNKRECIKILTDHQAWRRGDDTKPMTDPKTLGVAIDHAIHLLKLKDKNALNAAHYKSGIWAIKSLIQCGLSEKNPSACIDAILEFIENLDYNNPLAIK